MMSKRSIALLLCAALAAAGSGAAFGQQITRIAVVDLTKVISAYSSDAQQVKEFEQKKSLVQTEIDKMSAEIMRLMSLKADAEKGGDKAAAQKLKEDIDGRTKALTDFVNAKQAELDSDARKLAASDVFSKDLYKKIQDVAETAGYSLVLNLKSADAVVDSILWYSPMIDITADVIQALSKN
jgi:outer membrane protein